MKKFLYLFFSQYRWARKYIGGRWVKPVGPKRFEYAWVQWSEINPLAQKHLDELGWPLSEKVFECESW